MVASSILHVLVVIFAVAHAYREWEYLVRGANAFCANALLFVVSNLKLIGLLVVAVGVIGWRITSRS
jgi:hypothetical protein